MACFAPPFIENVNKIIRHQSGKESNCKHGHLLSKQKIPLMRAIDLKFYLGLEIELIAF